MVEDQRGPEDPSGYEAEEWSRAIGRNLRRIREKKHRCSQDALVQRLRSFGVPWTRSQLAKAERGQRRFTLEQVVLIAAAVDVPLTELLVPTEGRIALSEFAAADGTFLQALLDGTEPPRQVPHLDVPQTRQWKRKACFWRPPRHTEAEERLARELGTTTNVVGWVGVAAWNGRTFLEERERRLAQRLEINSHGSEAALRGHITRRLLEELRPVVKVALEEGWMDKPLNGGEVDGS